MKKFMVVLVCFFVCALVYTQSVTLTFLAEHNSNVLPLDSIYVENLTHGGDTVVYYPDNQLLLLGVMGVNQKETEGFRILKNYPNPFNEETNLSIYLEYADLVVINVFDIMGRTLLKFEKYLERGVHEFTFYSGTENIYFLTVEANNKRQFLKLINASGKGNKCSVSYKNTSNNIRFNVKSSKAIDVWAPGDTLRYVGYATISGVVGSGVIIDNPSVDETYTFEILYGQRCIDVPFVYDIEGNGYNTVMIGNQCWLQENLRAGKYNDSTDIYRPIDDAAWSAAIGFGTGAYAVYPDTLINGLNSEQEVLGIFGALYSWFAIDSSSNGNKNICPFGWRVPSDSDWTQLSTFIGGVSTAGSKLKETGTVYWTSESSIVTNETGFTARPAGIRDVNGNFILINDYNILWSSTEDPLNNAWFRSMVHDLNSMYRNSNVKGSGFSVRCVKE